MGKAFFNKNLIKILITISCILTFFALLSLENTLPITHYEASIYLAAPLFWFLIILSNLILIFCIIMQAQNENYEYFWLLFSLLILNNFIILAQPLIKGYFGYGSSDPWNHYKISKSIIDSGNIGDDYYPITHLLITEISEITSLKIETAMKLLPAYFSIIYTIFIYFLGKEVFKNKQYTFILVAVSSTFLLAYYQISVYPQGLSILILPLIFYLFFRSDTIKSINYIIMLILFLFLMPFFHPFVEITLIACLIAAEIIKYLLDRKSVNINKPMISIILFFTWWSSFAVFARGVKKLNTWMFSEVTSVPRTNEVAFTQSMTLIDTISLALKTYGSLLIYMSIALIAIILILWKYKKGDKYLKKMIILSALFVTSLISYYLTFVTQGVTSFGRFLGSNVAVWALPLLVSFPLFLILKNFNKKKLAFLLVFLIISSSFVISSFGNYRSSWIDQPNWHFTYADASAIMWEEQNYNGSTLHMAFPINGKINFDNLKNKGFDYYNHTSLADLFPENVLFLFGEQKQNIIRNDPLLNQSHISTPLANADLNEDTIKKIGFDPYVVHVYSNGADDIYLIEGEK